MNRNLNSRFDLAPSASIGRSRFKRSSRRLTSFNVGDIIPFYLDEVLPGDTFKIDTTKVVRMQTLAAPVMDNLYLDTYYFFVPNRLVWKHWKNFMGENTDSAWLPQTTYSMPQITSPSGGWSVGTIADHFGLPTGVGDISVSALPFRAYAMVINEFFRDENLQDPLNIPDDESTVTGVNTGTFVTDVAKGGLPYKAGKYHDYFTSCLPAPQKGPDVPLPVAQGSVNSSIPVRTFSQKNSITYPVYPLGWANASDSTPAKYENTGQATTYGLGYTTWNPYTEELGIASTGTSPGASVGSIGSGVVPNNLGILGSDLALSIGTINQLRLAFQIQKFYEKDARSGSRYIEVLKSHFGVTSPDARLQRPEYLGGNRRPLNISQVTQTSATGTTPQGNTAAFSLTSDSHSDFTRSFTEHGLVIGLMVARYHHTYQQGIERMWSRKDRFDFYDPIFANIGEQAVLNKEIYAQGSSVLDDNNDPYDDQVFGYQEAWAEYRYKPSTVTGEMRSQYATSLDVWHWADDYNALPSLSASWIQEDEGNVDRSLAVQSSVSNQLFADIFVQNVCTRPMPVYSIPGLIDHH